MDEMRIAESLLSRMFAGEFDGRLYKEIMTLPKEGLRQIVHLAEENRVRDHSDNMGAMGQPHWKHTHGHPGWFM